MSYSENVTKNDLKEVFTQLGLGVSFGQTYEAAWTATSTNSTPQRCTDSIYLPKGKYIGVIKLPVTSQESDLFFGINDMSSTTGAMVSKSQSSIPIIFEVDTDNRETYVVTGMSLATTYTYIERGYLMVICISDMKQYGTTVLDYYPVGSYYETSDSSFDPNTAWGGTWISETNIQTQQLKEAQKTINITLSNEAATGTYYAFLNVNSNWDIPANKIQNIQMKTYRGYWRVLNFYEYADSNDWIVASNTNADITGTAIVRYLETIDTYTRWHRTA